MVAGRSGFPPALLAGGLPTAAVAKILLVIAAPLRFSRLNFGKRWMAEPIGGGAYCYVAGTGLAVVVDSVR